MRKALLRWGENRTEKNLSMKIKKQHRQNAHRGADS